MVGTMSFESGKLLRCHTGKLRGIVAFYQLFEQPTPCNFAFKSHGERAQGGDASSGGGEESSPIDVLPAMLEALRRYDEFQQARALVPDKLLLKPTGVKPSRPADEKNDTFLQSLWKTIAPSASAAACEEAVPADSYRIRRTLAHWLEQGALQPAVGRDR